MAGAVRARHGTRGSGERPFASLDTLHRENLETVLRSRGIDPGPSPRPSWTRSTPPGTTFRPGQTAWPGSGEISRDFIVGPLSNGHTALLVHMAKAAGLPWDVILGSDVSRAYKPSPQAYLTPAALLGLDPGEVMLAAAHHGDLAAARRTGLATAFIARPAEYGPGQAIDVRLPADDWDLAATSITDLARRLRAGERKVRLCRPRPAAPARRSAPTTSAACCARRALHGRASDFAAGQITAAQLREVEDEAISKAVRMQEEVGLQSATDGEFRRATWHMDFIYQLGGDQPGARPAHGQVHQPVGQTSYRRRPRCASTARCDLDAHDLRRGLRASCAITTHGRAQADDPVAQHGPLPRRPRRDRPGRLPRPRRVLGRPGRRLRRGGARGWTSWAAPTCSSTTPAWPTSTTPPSGPRSPRAATTPSTCTCATSRRSTPRSRTGRPGWPSPRTCAAATSAPAWAASGGYDFVAEALFCELDVDGFFLEYDDERSGGFEPLRFVPPGKMVVLGLVTTKRPRAGVHRRAEAADRGRRPGSSRWTSCACPASAASPPRSRATR